MKKLFLALLFAFFASLVPHGVEIYNYFKHQDIYFLDGKPFIQNPDGYFFGRLAKDFKRGEDVLRNFPDGGVKYDYPPLISFMYGTLSKLTGIDIEWLGFWLSPIFGSLFVIPFILFWHRLGNLWVGFAGAVLTALSSAYYTRVFVLDLDTDNLNLFFIFSIALFLLLAYQKRNHWHVYLFVALAVLFSLLFYWWYARPEFFVLQFLGFLLLGLQNRRLFYAGLTGLLSLWALISFIAGYPLGMDILYRLFIYFGIPISPVESKSVPEVLKTIAEQGRVSFLRSYSLYFSSEFPFYIALIFLPMLFFRFFKGQLLLLPLYVLLVLSVVKGSIRIYMYSAPVLAMGFAYGVFLISKLSNFLEKRSLKHFVGGLFPPLMLMFAIDWFSLIDRMPGFFISKEVVKDLQRLKDLTPKDAKILSWWDYGYAIVYYSQRAVFHDGATQLFIKTPLIAYALLQEEKTAHKLFLCISDPLFNQRAWEKYKTLGLYRALEQSAKECQGKPYGKIYLLITEDMLDKTQPMQQLAYGEGSILLKLPPCEKDCKAELNRDTGTYIQTVGKSSTEYLVKEVFWIEEEGKVKRETFNNPKGGTLYLVKKGETIYGFFTGEKLKNSALLSLYTIRKDREGFRLVYDNFPYSVLYEIISPKPLQPLTLSLEDRQPQR
jgi:undecaprenyl-diphosphooligosaccharide--protein glycosyltransferase